jgi:hypothetical protein
VKPQKKLLLAATILLAAASFTSSRPAVSIDGSSAGMIVKLSGRS